VTTSLVCLKCSLSIFSLFTVEWDGCDTRNELVGV